ncbi:hypothetical protein RJT34_10982 [Clitoria ternatea]|uniref:Uncharacterized protein n=1 Tax=Clitoria ternatea TaxID=43366 RepID=A0AAN9JL22_CLITE
METGEASREGKRARVKRSSEKGEIVFVQLGNELVGIDLAKHCLNNSPPPILAVDYRVDHEFPIYTSSFRLDDRVILVGGGFRAESFSGRVYEFIFAAANDNERGEGEGEVVLPGHLVLRPAPSLNRPKPVIAVNLGGTIYVLLYWHGRLPDYLKDCDSSFERYDPISNSWITETSPPRYIELLKETPHWKSCPVRRHFVKDDKLFLYCDDNRIYVFSHLSRNWEIITLSPSDQPYLSAYPLMLYSHCPGIWLSGRSSSEGVSLSIDFPLLDERGPPNRRPRSAVPSASLHKPFATIYSSNGIPQYYQILDEVFSDMYPPGSMMMTYTCPRLLDLGQVGQGNQTRICAVMTGDVQSLVTDDFYTGCPYISSKRNGHLFISMFDVEILQLPTEIPRSPDLPPNSRQLLKVSTVKKLVFRLEKPLSFPPFNAFIL